MAKNKISLFLIISIGLPKRASKKSEAAFLKLKCFVSPECFFLAHLAKVKPDVLLFGLSSSLQRQLIIHTLYANLS